MMMVDQSRLKSEERSVAKQTKGVDDGGVVPNASREITSDLKLEQVTVIGCRSCLVRMSLTKETSKTVI